MPGRDEIVPVLDALRIALAHEEHDGRGEGGCIVGQSLRPSRRNEAAIGNLVDVIGEREGHDVGGQAVDNRARLLARSAVGLLDLDRLAGLGELARERRVDVGIELAGRIIRDIEQRYVGSARDTARNRSEQRADDGAHKHGFGKRGFESDQADLPGRNHSRFGAKRIVWSVLASMKANFIFRDATARPFYRLRAAWFVDPERPTFKRG